jgi:hypothetical protein
VDSEQPLRFEWYSGKQGDKRHPLGISEVGRLTVDGHEDIGTYSYWVRVYSGDNFIDSPTLRVTVIPDPETWEPIGQHWEPDGEDWKFVGSIGDLAAPPTDSQVELVPNIWIAENDKVLAIHSSGEEAHVQRMVAWGSPTDEGAFFLRLFMTESAPSCTINFYGEPQRSFIDVPAFTVDINVENGYGYLKFPGGVRIDHLETHRWIELKITFLFSTGDFSVEARPAPGTGTAMLSDGILTDGDGRSSRLRSIDGIRRVGIRSRASGNDFPAGSLFIDDFLFKRSPYGEMGFSPVFYSFWQDSLLEGDGSRFAGLGRFFDDRFPWIYFPASGKWLYVYKEHSSRDQIWGVVYERSRMPLMIFSGEQLGGWYLGTCFDRPKWGKF